MNKTNEGNEQGIGNKENERIKEENTQICKENVGIRNEMKGIVDGTEQVDNVW